MKKKATNNGNLLKQTVTKSSLSAETFLQQIVYCEFHYGDSRGQTGYRFSSIFTICKCIKNLLSLHLM
jgi:hypothetical protein